MDVSGIAAGASAALQQDFGVSVLKLSMNSDAALALQLIQAIPNLAPGPSQLGQNVDLLA